MSGFVVVIGSGFAWAGHAQTPVMGHGSTCCEWKTRAEPNPNPTLQATEAVAPILADSLFVVGWVSSVFIDSYEACM